MAEPTVRMRTADAVRDVCNDDHATNGDLTEAVVEALAEKRLIYPSRTDLVRRVVALAINGQPWNAHRETVSDRIYSELISSGEIISSWLY